MEAGQSQPHPARESTADELLGASRFRLPDLAAVHVRRPRLLRALSGAGSRPLVLVSAPAGTGKTSLVSEWIGTRSGSESTGWITFEEGDTDFWGVVLKCLSKLGVEVPGPDAEDGSGRLGKPRLMAVTRAIVDAPRPVELVVDGHQMRTLDLAHDVDYLLRHTYGRLRLVLVGRVDPVLPLYRYRLAETVLEIRAADLAFTDQEAVRLLSRCGAALSPRAVSELNHRLSGWVAGLRFAAMTLAGRDDPDRAVASVASQTSDINEYLVGEVLNVQTPEVRRFLLDSCVPDMLSPGLATELGGDDGLRILDDLSHSNAFIETSRDRPGCHRYYPFFRDLLRARLRYEAPRRSVELHHRAARWFQRQNLPEASLDLMARIEAWPEVAAQLVDGSMLGRLFLEHGDGPLSRIAGQLPPELRQAPAHVVRAALALASGDTMTCDDELAAVRTGDMPHETQLLTTVLDAVRMSLVAHPESAAGPTEEVYRELNRWAPRVRESELTAIVRFATGMVRLRCGELNAARSALGYAANQDSVRHHGRFRGECLGYLALIDALEGQLTQATRTAEESRRAADAAGVPVADQSPAARVALASVALDRYDLAASRAHVNAVTSSPVLVRDTISRSLLQAVVAGLQRAAGDPRSALVRLESAASDAAATDPWLASRLHVEAARISMASELPTVTALDSIEAAKDDPEAAAVAAAVHIEQGRISAAEESLARVRDGQPPLRAQVTGLLVEMVQQARHQTPGRSRNSLNRSLRIAAPEQLRRPFREAGPAVRRVLSADPRILRDNAWLDGPGAGPVRKPARSSRTSAQVPGNGQDHVDGAVVEALTGKELEVLGHLEALLTTEEIASQMYVSVNTVRTHVRSILRKLGVSRRNAAVRKARDLRLVGDVATASK